MCALIIVGGAEHAASAFMFGNRSNQWVFSRTTRRRSCQSHYGTPAPQIEGVRTRIVFDGVAPQRASANDVNRAIPVKDAHASAMLGHNGIQGVGVGISDDNPAEAAIIIYVDTTKPRSSPIPAVIDGLRTKIVEGDTFRAFGWGKEKVKEPAACAGSPGQSKKSQLKLKAVK